MEILKGETLTNNELMEIFKCGNRGRIRVSKKYDTLVLVSYCNLPTSIDHWKDEIYHFEGMGRGKEGGIFYRLNSKILSLKSENEQAHLFIWEKPNHYTFVGKVSLNSNPYQVFLDVDREEETYFFPLSVDSAKKSASNEYDTSILPEIDITNEEEAERFRSDILTSLNNAYKNHTKKSFPNNLEKKDEYPNSNSNKDHQLNGTVIHKNDTLELYSNDIEKIYRNVEMINSSISDTIFSKKSVIKINNTCYDFDYKINTLFKALHSENVDLITYQLLEAILVLILSEDDQIILKKAIKNFLIIEEINQSSSRMTCMFMKHVYATPLDLQTKDEETISAAFDHTLNIHKFNLEKWGKNSSGTALIGEDDYINKACLSDNNLIKMHPTRFLTDKNGDSEVCDVVDGRNTNPIFVYIKKGMDMKHLGELSNQAYTSCWLFMNVGKFKTSAIKEIQTRRNIKKYRRRHLKYTNLEIVIAFTDHSLKRQSKNIMKRLTIKTMIIVAKVLRDLEKELKVYHAGIYEIKHE